MDYLADTVTIIRHFSKTGKIGKQTREILEKVEQGGHHREQPAGIGGIR